MVHAGQYAPERDHSFVGNCAGSGGLVEGALGLGRRVQAAARTVASGVLQIREGLDELVDLDMCKTEGSDAWCVDDPSSERKPEEIADVEVCRPRPVTALT